MTQAVARINNFGGLTYVAPAGSLADEAGESALAEAIDTCVRSNRIGVVLDLERVALLGGRALEIILEANTKLRALGGSLEYAHASALVRDVLVANGIAAIGVASDSGPQPVHSPVHRGAEGPQSTARRRLGDILLEMGVVSKDQLSAAIAAQVAGGKHLGRILIQREQLSEADLLLGLSRQTGFPYLELRPGLYDPQAISLIPEQTARRLKVLPMFKVHNRLTLATANPMAIPDLDEIESVAGCTLRLVLSRENDIEQAFVNAYGEDKFSVELGENLPTDITLIEQAAADVDAIDALASGSPIISLVNGLIQRAVRDGASDIHFECFRDRAGVRFRIDGILYEVMTLRTNIHTAIVSRLKVMAKLDIAERRLPQDGRIQIKTQGRGVDLRFSSLLGVGGEKVVLRVLDNNQSILDVEKLGMLPHNLQLFKKLLGRSYGLVLATGPTGSGKTTTLYAAVNFLKGVEKNIVTIEDPVEYQMDIINQNQVNDAIGLSFARMLRHVLRQDPDIIMVGEIRDQETARIAVQSALTGHLVLSTLHTNDAVGALVGIMDMGVEPYLLSSALLGVVAQRLLRQVCPSCKTTSLPPPELAAQYGWPEGARLTRGRGCKACYDSGYRGRMAIHEIIETTEDLQRLMIKRPTKDDLQAFVRQSHMASMFDDGMQRVLEGRTSLEEVSRVIHAV